MVALGASVGSVLLVVLLLTFGVAMVLHRAKVRRERRAGENRPMTDVSE
jgi:hypothetical protein